ncbi:MAG: hypothetical protein HXK54_02650 [Atopobium sp.]|nr:hypothetical protein [Atopobium sp.]
MGLDAFVRCRCFEEGKLKPGPIPFEDLYIDDEDYICSKFLDQKRKELSSELFWERYGDLECDFLDWTHSACEHEYGEICSESVGNFCGLLSIYTDLSSDEGKSKYPLLNNMLPHSNDGLYPVEKAQPTLDELDKFIEEHSKIQGYQLIDEETHKVISTCAIGDGFCMYWGFNIAYGFVEDKMYFYQSKLSQQFYADHFCQIPADDYKQTQKVVVFCDDPNNCESNFRMTLPSPIDRKLDNSVLRSFSVQETTLDFKETDLFWRLNKIRNLLVASIETKHPICWC